MTVQLNTIRPGPLLRDGIAISTHVHPFIGLLSERKKKTVKMFGRIQGSSPPCWDEPLYRTGNKEDGRGVPVRNGTKNLFSYNLREGPHRYLAHRRLKEIDIGSSPPCRDGAMRSGVEKLRGRSVPIRNGTKNLFSYNLREGPHRYLAHRRLKEIDIGGSLPCRDGTMRSGVEKPRGRSVPVRFGRKYIVKNYA